MSRGDLVSALCVIGGLLLCVVLGIAIEYGELAWQYVLPMLVVVVLLSSILVATIVFIIALSRRHASASGAEDLR